MALTMPLLLNLDADILYVAMPLDSSTVFTRVPRRKEISLETCTDYYMIIERNLKVQHEDWICLAYYRH
jgi:hypothetical protein